MAKPPPPKSDPRTFWALTVRGADVPGLSGKRKVVWYRGQLPVVVEKPAGAPLGVNYKERKGKWVVQDLDTAGVAFKDGAGLLPGDEILSLNGTTFTQAEADLLRSKKAEAMKFEFLISRIVPLDGGAEDPPGAKPEMPDGSVRVLKSDLDQMRAQIKAELADEMRQELYNQLRAEVIAEIRGEIMHDDPATPNNVAIRTNMNEWSAFTP